jgi:hypothetical protein
MFGSLNVVQSMCGEKTSGSAPSSWMRYLNSLSTSMCIGQPQCAHSVLIVTDNRCSWRNRPCTKGVATASSAQAPYSRSPVLKVSSCGVRSTVTGYAQDTAPCPFRTRKKRFLSSSSSMVPTCARDNSRFREMDSGCMGFPVRESSLTT